MFVCMSVMFQVSHKKCTANFSLCGASILLNNKGDISLSLPGTVLPLVNEDILLVTVIKMIIVSLLTSINNRDKLIKCALVFT